ncbi:CopG family transcriptional regulator [Paenibacillus paeoniae]|uniref:CopG family transcriptional regulator n=1 Tax=Paenibacillus paeoniae TaxID=2292705 RepID=A0A371PI38_9BACL|nr:CopG family transcriptional regulator [Paenibacillus paeoniae]REK75188.1 CopG family transcriptional regulator [Paenibacillus paeoniae]
MSETEKITLNLGAVDLGQIDLLVEQGFYTNRTDLIRTGIRNQINLHAHEIKQMTQQKAITIGVQVLTNDHLESLLKQDQKLNLKVVGMLIVEPSVSIDLFRKVVETAKVYGIIKADNEIKKEISRH